VVLLALAYQPTSVLPALAAGADDYLPVDLPADELLARLGARMELARARARLWRRERAARRAAQAEARAREEFLAMVSHELRTPLGAILIWTQLLRGERREPGGGERALDMIERSTKSLAQLIDDLLDVSRIVAGKLRVERQPVDLGALVGAAAESARPGASARGVELLAHVTPGVPPVIGDAARLQQVAANLISNAVKFTPRGGRVEVTFGRVADGARLAVSDTGVGIEPEFLPHIFERFRQADSTSTRRYRGMGLGLAIARHLVELHGGTIDAVSRGANQGATLTVIVPLGLQAERPLGVAAASGEPPGLSGIRVFLVDDEPDARDAMSVLLRQAGASVHVFGSAEAAFEALRANPPDVLLSDIAMPGEDGYSLIRRVRALPAAEGGQVPAAAITAYTGPKDRFEALVAGYDEHLAKPLNPDDLLGAAARLGRRTLLGPAGSPTL
jgi:signal transduction histidine kinase